MPASMLGPVQAPMPALDASIVALPLALLHGPGLLFAMLCLLHESAPRVGTAQVAFYKQCSKQS